MTFGLNLLVRVMIVNPRAELVSILLTVNVSSQDEWEVGIDGHVPDGILDDAAGVGDGSLQDD
jgi:hypothetical protein